MKPSLNEPCPSQPGVNIVTVIAHYLGHLQKIIYKRSQCYKTGIPLHFYLHIYLRRNLSCLSRDTAWRYGKDYAAVHLSFYAISKKVDLMAYKLPEQHTTHELRKAHALLPHAMSEIPVKTKAPPREAIYWISYPNIVCHVCVKLRPQMSEIPLVIWWPIRSR